MPEYNGELAERLWQAYSIVIVLRLFGPMLADILVIVHPFMHGTGAGDLASDPTGRAGPRAVTGPPCGGACLPMDQFL